MLLGLSGGVDSGSLLLALAAVREYLPGFELAAVTFEDFDSKASPTFSHAAELASKASVEHFIAPAGLAERIFHLNDPLRDILVALMSTPDANTVMYLDHHTTRRTLEVFGAQNGYNKIALGLHTTDLVAGLLNGLMTGYYVADLPFRRVGDANYIYPLAFVHKKELHLYHLYKTGALAQHSSPNPWERNPLDRNFYYYLADMLQTFWPGMELTMFTAHHTRLSKQPALRYETCNNCGSALLHQPFTLVTGQECDACAIFRRYGYLY